MNQNLKKLKMMKRVLTAFVVLLAITPVFAQGGGSALGGAATTIGSYMTGLKSLIYAIAGIVGVVGGLRIYNKWTNGDQDINKEIVGWGGACVFLMAVPSFITAIFV